jgi:hypothetical protein
MAVENFANAAGKKRRREVNEEVRAAMKRDDRHTHEMAVDMIVDSKLRSTQFAKRLERIPPIPHSYEAIPPTADIPLSLQRVNVGSQVVQFLHWNEVVQDGDQQRRAMLFTTAQDLIKLGQADEVYVDGTFKAAPPPFYQLFTIHSRIGYDANHTTLMARAYMLLPGKTTAVYLAALNQLMTLMGQHMPAGAALQWTKVSADFEVGLLNALRHADFDPEGALQLGCCHFHFCSAVYKRFAASMADLYRHGQGVRKFVRRLFALPFLPVHLVQPAYEVLLAQAVPADLLGDANWPAFQAYFRSTWIDNARNRHLANVFNRERRTNNDVEGYHQRLNKILQKHPNLWAFIQGISEMHREDKVLEQQMEDGFGMRIRDAAVRRKEARLKAKREAFINGTSSAWDYLKAIVSDMPEPMMVGGHT